MLKSYGVGGARVYVVEPESMCGGLQHFSVSPRPLGFGFGTKGLGPGLDKKAGSIPGPDTCDRQHLGQELG